MENVILKVTLYQRVHCRGRLQADGRGATHNATGGDCERSAVPAFTWISRRPSGAAGAGGSAARTAGNNHAASRTDAATAADCTSSSTSCRRVASPPDTACLQTKKYGYRLIMNPGFY
jgi:hypothetical protein